MLHGDIRVNGKSIGYWIARRTEPEETRAGYFWYQAEIYMDGEPRTYATISHNPAEGAGVLINKIFRAQAEAEHNRQLTEMADSIQYFAQLEFTGE